MSGMFGGFGKTNSPGKGNEGGFNGNEMNDNLKATIQKMVQQQVKQEVDRQMVEFKAAYKLEMQQEMKKMIKEQLKDRAPANKVPNNAAPQRMMSPNPSGRMDPKSRSPPKMQSTVPKTKINMNNGTAVQRQNLRSSGSQGRIQSPKSERKDFKSPARSGPQGAAPTQAKSAKEDTVDPIYNNKDPITASIKIRKDDGSHLSVVKATTGRLPFFFAFELIGDGCPIDEQKKAESKANKAAKAQASPGKGEDAAISPKKKKLPCPISASIDVRRNEGGSHLSVVSGAKVDRLDVFKMQLDGPGCNPVMDAAPKQVASPPRGSFNKTGGKGTFDMNALPQVRKSQAYSLQ